MKSWCNLSWQEKRKIEEGNVNSFDYLTGYDFNTKMKVKDGQVKKKEHFCDISCYNKCDLQKEELEQ